MSDAKPKNYCGPAEDPSRYAIWATIGGGGEGTVFRGTRTLADGVSIGVAIKRYDLDRFGLSERLDTFVARLEGQVAKLRQFNHRGLAPVHDAFAGTWDHGPGRAKDSTMVPYMVMGFIEGDELGEWMEEEPTPKRRLRVLGDAAAALDEMHKHDCVHADIKPSNLRVTKLSLPDGKTLPVAVLVDFGLMRTVTKMPASKVVGSGGYLAPELYQGGSYSPASDLYAFAATAAFLFTEKQPTGRDQMLDDCRAAGLAPDGLEILAAALDPDPKKRAEALDRGVSGWLSRLRGGAATTVNPAALPPSEAPTAVVRPQPPNKGKGKLVAILAAALAVALIGVVWQPWNERSSEAGGDQPVPVAEVSPIPDPSSTPPESPSPSPSPTPSPSPSPSPSPTRSPSPLPTEGSLSGAEGGFDNRLYLTDLAPVARFSMSTRSSANSIAGQRITEQISGRFCGSCYTEQTIDYNLAGGYASLETLVGQFDDSATTDQTIRFEILTDGNLVFSEAIAFNRAVPVKVDLTNVVRLRLKLTSLNQDRTSVVGGFGDPRLFRS